MKNGIPIVLIMLEVATSIYQASGQVYTNAISRKMASSSSFEVFGIDVGVLIDQ